MKRYSNEKAPSDSLVHILCAGNVRRVRPVYSEGADMKPKVFSFTIKIRTYGGRMAAELALLASFAKRQPDGCEIYILRRKKK